jgi:hypothetical protein
VTLNTQDNLILVSDDKQYSYECKIIKSTDIPNQRFVARALNKDVNPQVPQVGEVYKFELDQTNQHLWFFKFPSNII